MEAGLSHVGRGLVVISEQKGQEGHKAGGGAVSGKKPGDHPPQNFLEKLF